MVILIEVYAVEQDLPNKPTLTRRSTRFFFRYPLECVDNTLQFFNNPVRSRQFEQRQEFIEIPELFQAASFESLPNPWPDLAVVIENCPGVVEFVGCRNEQDIRRFAAKHPDIGLFPFHPGLLFVRVLGKAVRERANHARHV
jgi:hypothetical protein